ncbi:hypothetical protein [Acidithiobacillus caldus]|uniref:hypothetical protein n=1 Tax=Acidithiobacillus caldus TaxID=33059 RepID=UPI001C07D849|nr:hypothetical protein [Acidithiobacillus caldus]MBU2771592.1 hypothetical protein [Acidithiobacillus caldus]
MNNAMLLQPKNLVVGVTLALLPLPALAGGVSVSIALTPQELAGMTPQERALSEQEMAHAPAQTFASEKAGQYEAKVAQAPSEEKLYGQMQALKHQMFAEDQSSGEEYAKAQRDQKAAVEDQQQASEDESLAASAPTPEAAAAYRSAAATAQAQANSERQQAKAAEAVGQQDHAKAKQLEAQQEALGQTIVTDEDNAAVRNGDNAANATAQTLQQAYGNGGQ